MVPVDQGWRSICDLVARFVDNEEFFEIEPDFMASELIIGFGRLAGTTVGIFANNPLHLAAA